MEDKSLENLFAQLDAESQTEAKTEEPAEEPAEAGTDPGDNKERVKLEVEQILASKDWTETEKRMLQATKFLHDLEYALVERDLIRRGVISAEEPELTEQDIAEAGEKLKAYVARDEAIRAEIKRRGGRGIKVPAPDWMKERAKRGDVKLDPEDFIAISKYIAEYYLNALKKKDEAEPEPPQVNFIQTDKLDYPLDKPNSVVWNWLAGADKNGQLTLGIDTSKNATGKEPLILYSINFDALEDVRITKTLTPFDKRVYVAVAALYNAGNEIITATQIYKMMGYKGRPGDDDLQAINDSLTKMGAARLYIDTDKENRKYPKYTRFKYDAALLPFERKTAYINGKLAESAIHPFREPPLITFASQRKQVTTITRALLESPVSKTEANLRLEDYLLERIGRMKNSKGVPRKMLFATIFEQCKITAPMQKQRAPEKIRRYLDHYKEVGWIDNYREEKDGVTIVLKSL